MPRGGPTSHIYFSQRLRLHYVDWGNPDAPPMILIHGGRDHCRNWDWIAEALRTGAQGMVDDMDANHGRPWGFPLQEIETRVLLWSCELDRSVPPAMGEYLARMIPDCEATLVSDAGHLWTLVHLHEVLEVVTGVGSHRGSQHEVM